ncbi:hypothetical protein LWI29_016033 [Acer saccharum]|uniref:Uncharacterized protein n=1 Tax=Acer saccharum TaxID=4024 RepID=A0AA39S450_ACESA|nr:hypothetical protein LWI29_016033 [Acer saccharum]
MKSKPDNEKQSKLKYYVEKHKKILHKSRDFYVKSMEDCSSKLAYGGVMGCPTAQVFRLPAKSFSAGFSKSNDEKFRQLLEAVTKKLEIQVDLNESEQDLRWPDAKENGVMKRSYTSIGLGKIGRIDEDKPCYFADDMVYVSVGDSELFYYFIESQGDPQEDPIFLWLTGGPGCSSFNGLIYEIGPMEFDIDNYKGGLPKLKYYPYAWTKTASIIFLDSPVGSGFSYSTTQQGWYSSDTDSAEQAYLFLTKWLLEHPQYLPLELFIGGDSYSGIIVPLITKKVVQANENGTNPRLNLIGYLLGSPTTDEVLNDNSKIEFAHRMALISDELYEDLKTSCNESYVNVDPSNAKCVTSLHTYKKCIKDINRNDILEPKCTFASSDAEAEFPHRSLRDNNPTNFILSPPQIPDLWCRNFNYALSYIWANSVKSARFSTRSKGIGLQVLVDSGDHDMVVPFVATQTWIEWLNLTVVNDWRPWFVDGQVAGYTVKYSENGYRLTYATVKGAGHTAPEYNRRGCYEMFDRWIHCRRYSQFAKQLNSCNFGVYAMDWIGHGGSDGLHGYFPSLDHVVADSIENMNYEDFLLKPKDEWITKSTKNVYCNLNAFPDIVKVLRKVEELAAFWRTCFGHLIDIPN